LAIVVRNNLTFEREPGPPLPADSAELQALAGHLRAGRCALFVGAGLSAAAGLPAWGTLIDRIVAEATPWAIDPQQIPGQIVMEDPASKAIAEETLARIRASVNPAAFDGLCRRIARLRDGRVDLQVLDKALMVIDRDSRDRAELQKLARQKRFTELAGQCRDRLGRERFNAFIGKTLTAAHDLPATHRDIVRTPYACVVTTNFDSLLEAAYARYGGLGVPRAPTGAELDQQGTLLLDRAFFVLKAHGDAVRPETMVFTADDYRRVIHANPAFQAVLGGILLTHAVLFVGYSLNDTNFRLLLDNQLTVFNGNVPPRYAVLSGVGPEECDILWKTAKLQVLPYPEGQHQEVGRCLAALADQFSKAKTSKRRAPRDAATSAAKQSQPQPHTTLAIDSDGDRVVFELVRSRASGAVDRVFVGGGVHPDTRALGDLLRHADTAQERGESPMADVLQIGSALANTLSPSLCRELARLPRRETIEIACSAAATPIPWEWAQIGTVPLALRHPLIRRPAGITNQARGLSYATKPIRALVIGDAGFGVSAQAAPLYFADLEATTIERLLRTSVRGVTVTRLAGPAATHRRLVEELDRGDYDVIHFGGHAWFDDREAFFLLWDRVMLGSELAPLLSRRPPALMVLDTHYTAFVLAEARAEVWELVGTPAGPYTLPPLGTPRGFAEAAMRCGVTSFVGTFGNIADETGAEFSVAFFAYALTGLTIAEALLEARRHTARQTRDSGLVYTAYGYPTFRLVEKPNARRDRRSVAKTLAAAKAHAGWSAKPARR
jgi:SIR2-like protein/CHAT domain-containing protein